MSKKSNNNYPKTWPAWVVMIGKELEAAEAASGLAVTAKGEPAWTEPMGLELAKLFHPTLRKEDYAQHGPLFMGKVLGHQRKFLKGDNGLEKQLERGTEAGRRFDEEMRRRLNRKAYARWKRNSRKWEARYGLDMMRFGKRLNTAVKLKIQAIKHALELSADQPEAEHEEFQRGYFEALCKELYDDQGHLLHEKLSSTTMIYYLMVNYWRWVKSLPSIPALHGWLSRVLGASQVGNLDRVKGICHRFGVSLAPRGRPRKKR